MARQRHFRDGRTGRNDLSRRLSDRKEIEQLSRAQLDLNCLKKKFASLKEEISLISEKEKRIRDFFERNAKSVFEKETALKYKYLVFLDEAYESGELTSEEKKTLLDLFSEESSGVQDFVATDEQREHLWALKYKYDELTLGMSREELDKEAFENTKNLLVNRFHVRLNKGMEAAQTENELLAAISDYVEDRYRKARIVAAGKKPYNISWKSRKIEDKKLSKVAVFEKLRENIIIEVVKKHSNELVRLLSKKVEEAGVRNVKREECLRQLAEVYAEKDLPGILMLQAEWLEEAAMAAPSEEEDLIDYNSKLRCFVIGFEDLLNSFKTTSIFGVEGPYSQLRDFAWKDLPIQMNVLLNRHKKEMKMIEEYVSSVSSISSLKSFLKRYGESHGDGKFFGGND